jgi:tetrahydromethanopterin S-methyltransferase subunit G
MGENTNPVTGEDITKLMGILSGFKTQYSTLSDDLTKYGKASGDTTEKLAKLTDDMISFQSKYASDAVKRLDAIEEKLNRAPATPTAAKSIGQMVIEDAGLLAGIKSGGRFATTIVLKGPIARLAGRKDITTISQSWPQLLEMIAPIGHPPIGVRQLIPQGRTSQGAVEYIEETSFTNNAAVVAEGAAKPKSDKVFTPRTSIVRTIAHYFKMSKQTFDDLPFLATQVENNGIWGIQTVEDNQLLNGSGAPPNLQGYNVIATAAPAPLPATGATLVDAIGTAIFDLAAKGFVADGTVVNPADWGHVAMLKNTQGNYIFANPLDYATGGRLWGTRLVASANQAAGTFLTGAFQGHSQLLDREDVHVQVANQNEDDFIKNMVTILIEERLASVIYQPKAFEKGIVPAGSLLAADAESAETPSRSRAK